MFPPSIPAPNVAGYTQARVKAFEAVAMDSGRTRIRRTAICAPLLVSLSWRLTQAQYDALEDWFFEQAQTGYTAVPLPLLDGTMADAQCMVTKPPSVQVEAETLTYAVSLQLLAKRQ